MLYDLRQDQCLQALEKYYLAHPIKIASQNSQKRFHSCCIDSRAAFHGLAKSHAFSVFKGGRDHVL